jgi:hypothetical protein
LENGTIVVSTGGVPDPAAKPILRKIAEKVNVGLLNGSGNRKNTRQLGSDVIEALKARSEPEV